MPDPQDSRPIIPYAEFAAAIRRAHPDLARPDISDGDLAHGFLDAFPEMRQHVHVLDPLEGIGPEGPPPSGLEGFTGVKKPVAPLPPGTPPPAVPQRSRTGQMYTTPPIGAMPILDAPSTGAEKVKEGVQFAFAKNAKPLERVGGINEAIAGGMEAATPLLVGSALGALGVTATALGAGILGQKGAEHVASRLGAPPEVAELAGNLTGLVTGARAVGRQGVFELVGDLKRRSALRGRLREEVGRGMRDLDTERAAQTAAITKARVEMIGAEARVIAQQKADAAVRAAKDTHVDETGSPFDYLDTVASTMETLPPGRGLVDLRGLAAPSPTGIGPYRGGLPAVQGPDALVPYAPPAPPYTDRFALGWQEPIALPGTTGYTPPPPPPTALPGLPERAALPPAPALASAPYTDRLALAYQSPIDPTLAGALDTFRRVPPLQRPTEPPPAALPPARASFLGAPEDRIYDTTGPDAPTIVQTTPPPPEDANALIRSIGAQLESTLTTRPPLGHPLNPREPRPALAPEELRLRTWARKQAAIDVADHIESQTGLESIVHNEHGEPVARRNLPAGAVYRAIVGPGRNVPPQGLVADLVRLYGETHAPNAAALKRTTAYQTLKGHYDATGRFKSWTLANEYARYLPEIRDHVRGRMRDLMEQERDLLERPASPPQDAPFIPPQETPEGEPPMGVEGGQPEPPPLPAGEEPIPDWLNNLTGDRTIDEPGAFDPDLAEPPLPGLEAVRSTENPTPPVASPVQPGFDLTSPPPAVPAQRGLGFEPGEPGGPPLGVPTGTSTSAAAAAGGPPQPAPSLFSRFLTEEEGALTLPPLNGKKLSAWLDKAADRYGDEGWHQAARQALDDGDVTSAWRIASIAAVRTAGAEARTRREEAGKPAPSPAAVAQESADAAARAQAAHRKAVEKQIGFPLPPSTDVSPEGVVTFKFGGEGVPAIKARATDLTLANSLLNDVTLAADPSQIVYMGRDAEANLRVNAQIADQIVRGEVLSDDMISTMAELTGLDIRKATTDEQRIEIARQYRRAHSLMGKGLGQLGNWTQQHMGEFYHYAGVSETGAAGEAGSVGALQAQGILTPEGFVKWLGGKATAKELADLGFSLPKGIEMKTPKGDLTPIAKTYARNWFRRQQRQFETQQTIDRLAGEGASIDKAIVRSTIAPELRRAEGGTFQQIMNLSRALLISRPATMIRNTWSQGMRYTSDILDDAVAGVFALGTGDLDQAKLHFTEAKQLAAAPFTKGTGSSVSLLKHPWADGLEAVYNYKADQIAAMGPDRAQKYLSLLQSFPEWEATYLGSLSLDTEAAGIAGKSRFSWVNKLTSPEVRNTITVLNRVQEHAYRAAAFVGSFRAQLKQAGLDPLVELAAGKDPRELIARLGEDQVERMIGGSVAAALDKTFAAPPMPGTVPDLLLDIFARHPVTAPLLQLGFPFPRFNFVSAPRWLWDHFTMAPLVDLTLYGVSAARSDASPMLRGRYYLMRQHAENARILAGLDAEVGTTEYDAAKFLGQFMAAKEDAATAAKAWKAIEKQAGAAETNPLMPDPARELHGAIVDAGTKLQQSVEAAEIAKAKWREAEARITNLRNQRQTAESTATDLKMAGAARSPQEYWARIATGTAMLGAAYMILSHKQDPAATRWYELPVSDVLDWMGIDQNDQATVAHLLPKDNTIDLRAYAPQVQPFLLADVLLDMRARTKWDEFPAAVEEAGGKAALADPHFWSAFFRDHYDGKYTSPEFTKDILEAYLSVSPAAGSTKDIVDAVTGRTAQGESLDAGALVDILLGQVGEFAARFTSPAMVVNDILGQFDAERAKARIPETGTSEKHSHTSLLTEPALANIPGVRERMVPEKTDPLTGRAIATQDPLARALGGITERRRNEITEEMTRVGLPYGAAVPRQSGDREYDNYVATRYAESLRDIWPEIVNDPDYQAAPPTIRKEMYLLPVFKGLKAGAAAEGYDYLVKKLVGAGKESDAAEVEARLAQLGGKARQRLRVLQKFYEGEVQQAGAPAEGAKQP